jgi:hypothetical protein
MQTQAVHQLLPSVPTLCISRRVVFAFEIQSLNQTPTPSDLYILHMAMMVYCETQLRDLEMINTACDPVILPQ